MRWLKVLVIGMGVAIVIGMAVVIFEIAQRASTPSRAASEAKSVRTFGDVGIQIPANAVVVDTHTGPARLTVRLRLSDGRAALLVIDTASGEKLGLITLDDRPAAP